MGSREKILTSIRAAGRESLPMPKLGFEPVRFQDRVEKYGQSLKAVGGQLASLDQTTHLDAWIRQAHPHATVIFTTPGVPSSLHNVPAGLKDPHDLEKVDLTIARGRFGVAENGAVWMQEKDLLLKAAYFICQHLVILLSKDDILDNMHQAYQRISLPMEAHGLFISGPSKTADIEQSLVIGAHGPRSCTVVLGDF